MADLLQSELPMTDEDIRAEYRQAKNKREQIRILMDENVCTENRIREVLGLPLRKWAAKPAKTPSCEPSIVDMTRINTVLSLLRHDDDSRVRNDIQNLAASLFWQELRRKGEKP